MTTRAIHKLNDRMIKAATAVGRLHDGGGLYFQITERGHRSWEYRYPRLNGKGRSTMGLGGYPAISLSKARQLHKEACALVADGVDPIAARGAQRQTAATTLTVEQAFEAYLTAQRARFKTERHVKQMQQRMVDYVYPVIGALPIADIKLAEIELVLSPIWETRHKTASRVRQYLEDTINWAIAKKVRTDESNPAEVKRLKFVLAFGISKTEHFASLPYDRAPEFMTKLRGYDGIKARALEFVMLNAVRVGDIAGGGKDHSLPMLWSHVDLTAQTWTIPDTKMGKPHVVPLSDAAMAVLGEMKRHRGPDDYVFPGAKRCSVIADSTLRYLIADMGYKGQMTTHGCRATFKTWASETTGFEKPVIEMALAHAQSELDQAYQRGSLLDKRRRLMAAWADYLGGDAVSLGGEVIALRA